MLIAAGVAATMGVESGARIRFGEEEKKPGTWAGRRLMWLDDRPAYELSFWCGTCPFLFKRLDGANVTPSLDDLQDRLSAGLYEVDVEVVARFAQLLPNGIYRPMLLTVNPRLIYPLSPGDYFSEEEVATWGVDGFWGLPEYPQTPYYRGLETEIGPEEHFYEFVVPMVPPSWNDRDAVRTMGEWLAQSPEPTAVAVSLLDVRQPAIAEGTDYYAHWCLTHFLLDGHHKFEAAAAEHTSIRLLTLLSLDASLAKPAELERIPVILDQPHSVRRTEGPTSA